MTRMYVYMNYGSCCSGLGGSPRLLDVGGVPYMMPSAKREKMYEMRDYSKLAEIPKDMFIIGAAAAPWTFLDRNAEVE